MDISSKVSLKSLFLTRLGSAKCSAIPSGVSSVDLTFQFIISEVLQNQYRNYSFWVLDHILLTQMFKIVHVMYLSQGIVVKREENSEIHYTYNKCQMSSLLFCYIFLLLYLSKRLGIKSVPCISSPFKQVVAIKELFTSQHLTVGKSLIFKCWKSSSCLLRLPCFLLTVVNLNLTTESLLILRTLKNSILVKGKDAARPHKRTPARIGKLLSFSCPISESVPHSVLSVQNLSPLFQSPGGM